jgi:hypothetical protein
LIRLKIDQAGEVTILAVAGEAKDIQKADEQGRVQNGQENEKVRYIMPENLHLNLQILSATPSLGRRRFLPRPASDIYL